MGGFLSVPMVIAIALPVVAGSIVSASTAENVLVWYKTLKKPSWNLPTPIFGPTWGILYVLLGLASFVVWTQGGFAEQSKPLLLYGINLILNLAWMPIFFNQKNLQLAQIDNIATLVTGAALAKMFYHVKPVAGYLLWPYVAFLLFANCLNWFHLENNANRAIEEPLYEQPTKKNPGEAGYEAPSGNPQGYAKDDPGAVNKGSGVSGAVGREKNSGIEWGGSTTGETFQRPGGSTTGGSFKPTGCLGSRPAPAARPLPARRAGMQSKFLGARVPSRVAATVPRGVAAARFA